MTTRSRLFAVAVTSLVALTIVYQVRAEQSRQQRPKPHRVEISPNALQKASQPMQVNVVATKGQTLHLFILQSCDSDPSTPDLQSTNTCQTPLWHKEVTIAANRNDYATALALDKLRDEKGQSVTLPGNVPLWLRVSADPTGRRARRDVLFAIAKHPCGPWKTFLDFFGQRPKGGCQAGVRAAFTPQKGIIDELPRAVLQVRRMNVSGYLDSVAGKAEENDAFSVVPRTHGATGVNWLDNHTLVVTQRELTERERSADRYVVLDPAQRPYGKSGMYLHDLANDKREPLYHTPPYAIPGAPYALSRDLVVLIEDDIVARPQDDSKTTLVVWRRGKKVRKVPIDRSLHQILGVNRKRRVLLAYSLFRRAPKLVYVCMRTGRIIDLGSDHRLLHAVMHSPSDEFAALALENNASARDGWELILVDNEGKLKHRPAVGTGHDLMPTWRPDGAELAFLGQVSR